MSAEQQEPVIAGKGEGYVELNRLPDRGSELDKWFCDLIEKRRSVKVIHTTSQYYRGFLFEGVGNGSLTVWVPALHMTEEFLGRYSPGAYSPFLKRIDSDE